MIKRALISVWNKEGIVELGQFLKKNNVEILSTGGTQTALENADINVISVSDITGKNVKTIFEGNQNLGQYHRKWQAGVYPSGIYFINISTSNYSVTQKIVLIKYYYTYILVNLKD